MSPLRDSGRVGKRGAWVIPVSLRRRFGIDEGSLLLAEETAEGILLRPAEVVAVPVETPERHARLLLEAAASDAEYERAERTVRGMGLDPKAITGARRAGRNLKRRPTA